MYTSELGTRVRLARAMGICVALVLGALSIEHTMARTSDTGNVETILSSDGTLRRIFAPVLMYHYISELPEDADDIRTELTVRPEQFDQHLRYLAESGYESITPQELLHALQFGAALPKRPVLLTFDDGHLDHYMYALPILQRQGFSGTFFIITQFADESRPEHLNWAHIQALAEAGMSIESHTKTHADLRNRSYDFLVYELLGSIESIQAHINARVSSLAYPIGRYDENVLHIVRNTPIQIAFTTRNGAYHTSDRLLELPRLRVSHHTSVTGLAALIQSAP